MLQARCGEAADWLWLGISLRYQRLGSVYHVVLWGAPNSKSAWWVACIHLKSCLKSSATVQHGSASSRVWGAQSAARAALCVPCVWFKLQAGRFTDWRDACGLPHQLILCFLGGGGGYLPLECLETAPGRKHLVGTVLRRAVEHNGRRENETNEKTTCGTSFEIHKVGYAEPRPHDGGQNL